MNCTLSRITEAELDAVCSSLPTTSPLASNEFATAPMAAVMPAYQPPTEEELYTSFEAAISERISSFYGRLNYLSNPALYTQSKLSRTNSDLNTNQAFYEQRLTGDATEKQRRISPAGTWQRYLIFFGLALICTMIGFDLMGLLVLAIR